MQPQLVRQPAVAGLFYPDRAETLARDVEKYLSPAAGATEIIEGALGCIVPHAGYKYSGAVAGAVYRRMPSCASYIVLGPNHWVRGEPFASMSEGSWRTPLGDAPIDTALAKLVKQSCHLVMDDAVPHTREHSLEVQLPFLQKRVGNFRFFPISIGAVGFDGLTALGRGLAQALRMAKNPVLVIASSDMNHEEPDGITRIKDRKAIDKILDLDPRGLYDVKRNEEISMCGYGPAIAMLTCARELGATKAELIQYATSAETSGDRSQVVGYAGIVVSK